MRLRIGGSVRVGPFRIGASVPVNGRGRTRVWAGERIGPVWVGGSASTGRRKAARRGSR
jgi:hypothetical protein